MIGSFAMIAISHSKLERWAGNVNNVKILCFARIAINSLYINILWLRTKYHRDFQLPKILLFLTNWNPAKVVVGKLHQTRKDMSTQIDHTSSISCVYIAMMNPIYPSRKNSKKFKQSSQIMNHFLIQIHKR